MTEINYENGKIRINPVVVFGRQSAPHFIKFLVTFSYSRLPRSRHFVQRKGQANLWEVRKKKRRLKPNELERKGI